MVTRCFQYLLAGFLFLAAISGHAGTLVQFRTSVGTIDVELYDQDKPATVENFKRYIRSGAYQNMFFHRWSPGFVVQGGGFFVTNRTGIQPQILPVRTFPAITNEYNVGRKFSNVKGTIAMARVGGETNSATSQFFFNTVTNAFLDNVDGGFTVFGRVIRGMEILDRFNTAPGANGIYRLALNPPLNELPVLWPVNTTFEDLIFVDVTTLGVEVRRTLNGQWEISWFSVPGVMNHVEVTTTWPPQWQTVTSIMGNGFRQTYVDTAVSPQRFYRVRATY